MSSMFKAVDHASVGKPRALAAPEIVAQLARLTGWSLSGDSAEVSVNVAIEKTFRFANYFETMAFVNALAWIAHRQDHHPDLSVHYDHCTVRFSTHDVGGLSLRDFECAARVDALLES